MAVHQCSVNCGKLCSFVEAAAIACKHVQDEEASTSGVDDIPLETKLGISVRVGGAPPNPLPAPSTTLPAHAEYYAKQYQFPADLSLEQLDVLQLSIAFGSLFKVLT